MNVTFTVTLEVDDTSLAGLTAVAEDIHDDLESAGHLVVKVDPWARPSTLAAAPTQQALPPTQ